MPVALHALHTQQWTDDEPAPPSPTLTNPDNILPTVDRDYSIPIASRAGFARRQRPPSPSYLRERSTQGSSSSPAGEYVAERDMGRKDNEKPGLVSRKMLLLRSRTGGTASNGNLRDFRRNRNISHGSIDSDYTSPVLQDVGNLAPEQPVQQAEQLQLPEDESRRKSGSSSGLSGMADFLAKYAKPEGTGSDDETVDDNALQFESGEVDAQRRKQEMEEHNSAILSKRAEQILANAKKRLNVMEGNLRGARDLVAPLTAANLKRATSLGSAHATYSQGGGSHNSRVRYIPQQQHYDQFDRDADLEQNTAYRTLHSQASTPALGRQYQYQHTRNFSEINLPDRPFTSLDQHRSGTILQSRSRTPSRTRATESPTQTPNLRGSKSYDSLGMGGRERPLHNRSSPDSNHLEALPEGDDEATWRDAVKQRYHHQTSLSQDTNNGLGLYRPTSRSSSRTSDLREQMSSLKGRISTLKDRAREDSLRRQSQANLRATETTPFNNADGSAPELFYNPGVTNTQEAETFNPRDSRKTDSWVTPGSRNAFAVQAEGPPNHQFQYAKAVEVVAGSKPERKVKVREIRSNTSPSRENGRKRSGTVIDTRHRRAASEMTTAKSAEKRHSHHQLSSNHQFMPGTFQDEKEVEAMLAGPPSPPLSNDGFGSSPVLPIMSHDDYIPKTDASVDDDYAPSESDAGESIYEDAVEYEGDGVVPHEHREDAFDYENFFLSGAMARYNSQRRPSDASTGSMSSTETARGPAMSSDDTDEDVDADGYVSDPGVGGIFPPPTPQTPERLRAIERGLAERSLSRPVSEESISTINSFATARENGAASDDDFQADERDSPPVSPITESLNRFSNLLTLPSRPVSPLSDAGRDGPSKGHHDPFSNQAKGLTVGSPDGEHASPSSWNNRMDSPLVDMDNRPRTAVRLRRSSSSDRADSGIGSETKSGTKKPAQSAMTHRHGQPSRDLTSVAVNALLDPAGVGLGLRDNAVLFGVVESLRHVVREMQRREEEGDGNTGMSKEMRMLMMRRRLERARGALDGGFGGA